MRRIVSFERRGEGLEVLTTSQKLAHRIASQLKRSFGGTVTYAWSDRDGELYATWQREDVPPPPAPPRRRRIRGRATTRPSPDVEIQARGLTLDPAWRDLIERSVAKLAERYPEPLRVHVTLTHSRHHRHGAEAVSIVANLPGTTLRVSKQEPEVTDAIHATFRALGADFARFHRERRRA
jgi:ribosome-associated translation inhibitor RaiA